LYSARWEDAPLETYAMRLEGPESRPLGLPNAMLHAVSSLGEIAVVLRAERGQEGGRGVLARMPLAGGAPREILEDVLFADWSPDGRELAVVRIVGGRQRLDFPIGSVVYEPTGWISSVKVSPGGDLVAFVDHAHIGDTTGSIAIADRKGRVKRLSGVWPGETYGLAWSPGGEEIWFTAAGVGTARSLHAVTLEGRERLVEQVLGGLYMHDVSPTGRVLLSHDSTRSGILCRIADEASERELSWFDLATWPDLSGDGSTVLFSEGGVAGGPLGSVYLRRTDGSPAIRLGEGTALALSPDGKWALSLAVSPGRLLLHPTGVGQTRELLHEGLTHHAVAAWFPDGKRILFAANQEGRPPRSYVQDLDCADANPVTPEGSIAYAISPDGSHLAARDPLIKLCRVEGGDSTPIAGALPGDIPIRFDQDGRSLFVQSGILPARVFRIDTASGARGLFLELMPSDPAGVSGILRIALTPDGRSYVYDYFRVLSDLYLAEGLK
ncbi:MAG TPA: hypothetical protein VGK70_05315, partial [Thermoanaerobaculia bacterium]